MGFEWKIRPLDPDCQEMIPGDYQIVQIARFHPDLAHWDGHDWSQARKVLNIDGRDEGLTVNFLFDVLVHELQCRSIVREYPTDSARVLSVTMDLRNAISGTEAVVEMMDTRQAAAFLGIKPSTLNAWRSAGRKDPPFIKMGRSIRYSRAALESWKLRKSSS